MTTAKKHSARPGRPSGKSNSSRLRGWLIIVAVAIGTLLIFVAGTIDPALRYSLIGL